MGRKSLIFFVLLLQFVPLSSLWKECYATQIVIRGRVSDASSGRVVPFASILVKGSSMGIVANNEGVFTFKVAESYINDTLIVSYLGYNTKYLPISSLNLSLSEPINSITLLPSTLHLDPAYIFPQNPLSIVQKALSRIRANYGEEWLEMSAFYREMIKRKERYISINEAVLKVNRAPYNSSRRSRIAINKGRGNHSAKNDDTLMVKLQGGPISALEIDILKEPFFWIDILQIGDYYHFTMGQAVEINGKLFYRVDFAPKAHISEILFRGSLYIDPETFAVARAQYSMNVEGRKDASNIFIVKSPPGVKFEILGAHYLVNYREVPDLVNYRGASEGKSTLWHFDYSRTKIIFGVKWPRRWFSSNYSVETEMAVTDIAKMESAIPTSDLIKMKDILSIRVEDYLDPNFWGDYNTIEPEAPIEKILGKIAKSLRK